MANNNEHDRATPGGVNALPELVFDVSHDKSKPMTVGKTQTPMNQLPELSWDCSKPKPKMAGRVWGIKLGSGGSWIPFCERHGIIGLGYEKVDPKTLSSATRAQLWSHVKTVRTLDDRKIGKDTWQLYRSTQEANEQEYIL